MKDVRISKIDKICAVTQPSDTDGREDLDVAVAKLDHKRKAVARSGANGSVLPLVHTARHTKQKTLRLYYFNARGRAETIRLTFVMSGIQFEDCRIEGRDWAALKPKTPTGRLPYLEVTAADGTIRSYDESGAIVRWLAKSHDLMGNSNEQYYRIERVIGQCTDIDNEMVGIFHAKTDEDKVSRSRKFQKESGVKLLKLLKESLLESTDKFVAGSNVTLGNLTLMTTVDLVDAHFAELMKNQFPELLKHRQDVLSCHPKLAEYVKSRPVSQW